MPSLNSSEKSEQFDTAIIGLIGPAGSGKNAVGEYLARVGGARLMAFADPLRQSIYATNPYVSLAPAWALDAKLPVIRSLFGCTRLASLVDERGWDGAKALPDVRRLLQRFGTEGGREVFGKSFWVETAAWRVWEALEQGATRFVFTDVRFPEEVDFIRRVGGVVVRVVRPGYEPLNSHPSENALWDTQTDFGIVNNGTLSDLAVATNDLAVRAGWLEDSK